MAESLAIQAYQQQSLDENRPENTRFPGHDTFQNGVIENGQPTTLYAAATNRDIENIKAGNSGMSGFMTDEATVNFCKNENGILDANALADKTQTQPWRDPKAPEGTDYTYRENLAAFNVNWDKLNSPENADLKERLCDSDGNLKCAFGKVEQNTQWGDGGGNQYYFNKEDFNEAVNRGVFQYDENKTLKESDGNVVRSGVSERDYRAMDRERQMNARETLDTCQDKNAKTDVEKAKSLNEITPEKSAKINSAQASEGNYIAKPDPAYNYPQHESPASIASSTSPERNEPLAHGGGARAPNTPIESPDNRSNISGELPPQNQQPNVINEGQVSGTLPPQNTNSPASQEHQNQISGTLPDQAQGIELPNNHTGNAVGKDLAETATKNNSTNFNPNNGIS